MCLFHYSTWTGSQIFKDRILKPDRRFQKWCGHCLVTEWPALLWLTENEYWEPCVQAYSKEGYLEKCGSCPETYASLGIPCWKFQVWHIPMYNKFILTNQLWQHMIQDAVNLGSNPQEWKLADKPIYVLKTWKWIDNQWEKKL